MDYIRRKVEDEDKILDILIWDTAGNLFEFKLQIESYVKGKKTSYRLDINTTNNA